MTKRAILLVHTNPVSPDRESEFNEWYDRTHIPQILGNVPGMIGASRYVIADSSPSGALRAVPGHDLSHRSYLLMT